MPNSARVRRTPGLIRSHPTNKVSGPCHPLILRRLRPGKAKPAPHPPTHCTYPRACELRSANHVGRTAVCSEETYYIVRGARIRWIPPVTQPAYIGTSNVIRRCELTRKPGALLSVLSTKALAYRSLP